MKRLIALVVPLFLFSAFGSEKEITVEGIITNQLGLKRIPRSHTWRTTGDSYLKWDKEKGWMEISVKNGKGSLYLAKEKIAAAFEKLPGFSTEEAQKIAERPRVTWNHNQDGILYNSNNDLFFFSLTKGSVLRLTYDAQEEVGEDFSPNDKMVSFIRDYNIHLVDLDSGKILQITKDGSKSLLYGRLDWVYQEELYGRGNFRGYWWSPDSTQFAFLRIDESEVPLYTVVDHLPYRPELEVSHYPKAGDANPKVKIGVVPATGGAIQWMDTFAYEGSEYLIVRVAWHPDSSFFTAQIQNREQNWLHLNGYDPKTGTSTSLIKETSKTWVDVLGNPHWSPDGKHFIWSSERDGWNHLYLYDRDGNLVRQLTSGEWEAFTAIGFSEDGSTFYYGENRDDFLQRHLSKVILETGKSERLSSEPGSHFITMAPGSNYYFSYFSSVDHAGRLSLYRTDGKLLRHVDEADMSVLEPYGLLSPEFVKVPTRDGFMMEAVMIKPPNFDASKRYPVMSYTYSGPHAPSVRNRWGGVNFLWHQMLAKEIDCLIWICDNRTASGKGKVSVDPVYRNFGELELQDLEDGLNWLKKHPFVDPDRIGLWGWSYGGYMTLYALTHSKSFKLGIAGASVTDWRDYDTIYTERYMAMPQNNAEGYEKSSPVNSAADLQGNLLIIHGTMDDNVHMQNTIQMINALQNEGKSFEMMMYPRARHGVRAPKHRVHLYNTMTSFLKRNL